MKCIECDHYEAAKVFASMDDEKWNVPEEHYVCPCINELDPYYSWEPKPDWFCANFKKTDGDI